MNGEPSEDIEELIKKLQESEEERRNFEEKCKKSLLREYYLKRESIKRVTREYDVPLR
jgi:transposase-like protein